MPQAKAPAKAPSELHLTLEWAEVCLAAVSHALVQGQPDLLRAAVGDLHASAHKLSLVLQGGQGATAFARGVGLGTRLRAVAQALAMQREACVRRLAVVERSLHAVIPSTRPSTYGGAVGAYGRGGKQGGAFRTFS